MAGDLKQVLDRLEMAVQTHRGEGDRATVSRSDLRELLDAWYRNEQLASDLATRLNSFSDKLARLKT